MVVSTFLCPRLSHAVRRRTPGPDLADFPGYPYWQSRGICSPKGHSTECFFQALFSGYEGTPESRVEYLLEPCLTNTHEKRSSLLLILSIFFCHALKQRWLNMRTFRSCLFGRHSVSFRKIRAAYINLLELHERGIEWNQTK